MPEVAAIFGISGPVLTAEEKDFFAAVNPFGFILFDRNIETPDQVRDLTMSLRKVCGFKIAPVLIDQEGGRVQRMKPPHWRQAPPASLFGRLYGRDPVAARRAVYVNTRLIAGDLTDVGINVDCAPLLDIPATGAHPVIGDRAFSIDPVAVAALGTIQAATFLENGVFPVIKHLPGHGRATLDSHHDLPVVDTQLKDLEGIDFLPFRSLNDSPFGMTAHIVYSAFDDANPATFSSAVIEHIIRGRIGFTGLLMSDDISMGALKGSYAERAGKARAAGCDLVLHCNGNLEEMREVAKGAGTLGEESYDRWKPARDLRKPPRAFDRDEMLRELEDLVKPIMPPIPTTPTLSVVPPGDTA